MRAEDFLDSTPQAGGISAEDFLGPAKQKKQNQGIAADLVTDVKRGVEQLPGAVTGLVDIPIAAVTGSPLVSGLADKAGEITGFQPSKWAKQAEAEYSPSRQAGRAEVDKAWEQGTASDIAGAYLKNPMNIVGSVAESLPSMLAGGLAGRAALGIGAAQSVPGVIARTVGTKMAPAVGAGIGEGGIMAGQAMQNSLDAGVDPRTAAGYAGATGLVGGALGALGGKVAQKMGVVDPETLIAGGVGRQASNATGLAAAREVGKRVAGGAISEGLFEELPQSVFEQGFQNLAQGKPLAEGMARAGVEGALAGSFMGGAFNMLPGSRYAQAKLQERPPEDEQQPIAGLLPAPRYPVGDRNFTDYDYLQANQAAIDAADKNAADLYAMRDAFEASRQNITLTTDPVPLQQRFDELISLGASGDTRSVRGLYAGMDDKARAQYEKDVIAALSEPIGIRHDANQREVPFTMGEYLDAQVSAEDALRAREEHMAQSGNREAANRLAQLADEEAQQHIGIVQDLARSATQGGALSKAALTGIQTGATQMPVHPERAAIQQQMLADEAAQAELAPIELFMRGRNERQLQNLSAPGHSQATRQAATAEIERRMTEPVKNIATNPVTNVQAGTEQQAAVQPDPQFDVSKRTDAQLANLASAGKTPEKRAAAVAELQRRAATNPLTQVTATPEPIAAQAIQPNVQVRSAEKPAEPQKTDSALQNRDRGRAASVNQMQSIARNPDYMRLGPSRTPDSGAPMVFAVGNDLSGIPAENFGASDVAVMADGQRVPFRYAVIDASRVQPSNFADGMANPAFASNERGTIKALNNGRTAGIRAAHSAGNADAYVGEMIEDGAHGVSSEAIRNAPNPMLVRVYAEDANTDNMAAKSQGQGLGMSASERAAQDAELMTGDVLDKFAPLDIAAAGNRDFVRAFVGKLPENELADMMDATGNLSQDGRRRIEAALLTAAYGKSDLVQELFESTDTDIKAIGNALKVVSGQWAIMRQAAKDGVIDPAVDMTGNLMEAVNIIRRSRAEGSSVAELAGQGDLMGGNYLNELSELFLRIFYRGAMYDRSRSGEKVITGLQDVVTSAMNTKADAGLFGDSFKPTPKQIVQSARSKIDEKDQPASQSALFGANGQATAISQGNRGESAAQSGEVGQRPVGTNGGEEVGKQAEPVAQQATAPVERKVTTEDARGQQDNFAQPKQGNATQSNAKSDAFLARTKDRNEIRFETPYIGIGGNYSLVGYVWPNKKEEYIDRRGEDRVRTVSDWEAAVENLETGRQIVHQFAVKKPDGTEQDVSAETAAKLLGVSESTVRNNAKKQLEKAIAKEKSRILEIKEADDLDAIDAQDSPAMAVSKRAMTYSNNSPMIERMAKSGESWATIDNRIERESAGREKYRFLTKDGKFVWSHSFVKEGDEEYKRGWRNAEFSASEIWPAQPVKATTEAKAVEPAAQSAEQKIRSAFDALPSVSLGVAYPITVEHNGVKREFMVRQDALGRGKIPALHVVAIHQGRMIASDEKSWIAQSYKLNWKNELTEEGLPKKISDQEADEFKANFKGKPAAVDAKKEEKSPTEPKRKIEDAGETLVWNKKNPWLRNGVTWDAVKAQNETLRAALVKKEKVWPRPKWEDFLADLPENMQKAVTLAARLVKDVYDALPTAPSDKSDAGLQAYIEAVTKVRDASEAFLKDEKAVVSFLAAIVDRAKPMLTAERGRPVSLSALSREDLRNAARPIFAAVFPKTQAANRIQDEERQLSRIIGNKAMGAMQVDNDQAVRAMKDIENGWPASREAWERQGYQVIGGDGISVDYIASTRYSTNEPYVSILFRTGKRRIAHHIVDGATSQDDPRVQSFANEFIGKMAGKSLLLDKGDNIVSIHDTEKDAKEAARELVRRSGGKSFKETGTSVDDAVREGVERRTGDVTEDQTKEAFGFRGVNFGNYVKQDQRQAHLNAAYDALYDLADTLGVPPKALGLNGMLGLAIGAQGSGMALAHFVPGQNEINITRDKGAGSLAHEWGHALDHYFATQAGLARDGHPFLSEHAERSSTIQRYVMEDGRRVIKTEPRFSDGIRPEIVAAFAEISRRMNKIEVSREEHAANQSAYIETVQADLNRIVNRLGLTEKAASAGVSDVLDKVRSGDVGEYVVFDDKSRKRLKPSGGENIKALGDATGLSVADMLSLHDAAVSLKYAKDQKAASNTHLPQKTTDYRRASRAEDKKKGGKTYWSTNLEMFARAFESFVFDRVKAGGARNDYLVRAGKDVGELYPHGVEREAINAAFKTLVDTIETKEDDKGVALYSKSGNATQTIAISRKQAESRIKSILGDKLGKVLIDSGIVTLVDTEQGLRNLNGAKYMVAWHGSPHDHNKFDSSKIGTGEGAQAYGYGLYFAGSRDVAEYYKETLTNRDAQGYANAHLNAKNLVDRFNGDAEWAAEVVSDQLRNTEQFDQNYGRLQKTLEFIKSGAYAKPLDNPGKLYQVELAPSEDEYLDWDKPLSEQSEFVRKALDGNQTIADRREKLESRKHIYTKSVDSMMDMTGQELYELIADNPTTIRAPGDKAASDYLHSIGIRGIRYLDGSSRSAGEGTSNYVIFSDDDVAITAKYAKENGGIRGATLPDGRIVLVLENLNADNFNGVFAHEGFHSAIRDLVGEQTYAQLMKRLDNMRALGNGGQWFKDAVASVPAGTRTEHVTEEIAAYAVQGYVNGAKQPNVITRWVESLLSALRTAIIRRLPFGKLKSWAVNNLQPQDLANLAIAGLKAKARGQLQAQGREVMAFSRGEGVQSSYELPNEQRINRTIDRAELKALRRAAARLERPEAGITFRIDEDGTAIATGPKGVRVPERYIRFANDNGLAFEARRLPVESGTKAPAMPDTYRVDGALYFGEMASNARPIDRTGKTRFSKIKQTDTPAFKKWFGKSAVVDADGKPLVVYHGTNADFSVFKTTRGGEFGPAIYLTDNPREAGEYGEAVKGISFAQPSANIMPVYARIENPYTKGVDEFWKEFGGSDSDAAGVERAKSAGYDGIIAKRADRYYDNVAHEFVDLGNTLTHYIAFSNTQVKSAIGNNGNFDGTNPDIRYSRAQIIGDSGRQYDQTQRQFFKNVGRDIEKKNLVERTTEYLKNDFWKKMAVGIVDQFRGLRDLGDNGQAYMLARLSKGTAGAFDALLHHGKLSIRDGVYDADTSGGFIDRLGTPLHGELDDFLWYVAANRAEGLSKVDRENLFTPADIAAGKSLAKGQTNFDYTIQTGPQKGTTTRNRTAIYADANRVFNEFQKNTLDMAEQSGLIDGASRKLWESEFYVPFYRVSEEDGEFIGAKMGNALVRQQAFKKLKGGTDKLNSDLLSNTLLNFSHLIEASAKNRAAKASLAAAENIGAASRVAPDMASYAASSGSMLPPGTKGTVWFQENGKKVEYKVSDPFVMTAITSLEYAGMRNGVMDVMTKFKHFLTIGVTASPAFKVRNLIRDSIQSIGASELGYNPIKNIAEGYKQTRRDSQEYVSALASGALIRFGTMLEGSESARVRQLVKSGVKDSTILNSENKWRAFYDQYLEPAVSAYNELGNRSEEINRAALYNQLVKQGKSHAEAALLARDLMDFSMQGSFNTIRFLTQVVPFMNARLQGMYKLGRAAKDNPRKLAVVTGAVAMASIALMLAYGDDDDWKRREDWDRDNFWWFKLGGIEFRIPKPFEIGAIATLAERGLELMIDDEMTGDRFRRVVNSLAMNNLSMNPIPQAFKPILDLYANKDSFTGRPIESMGMERLDPTERFNSNTTMVARGLSSASLGALSPVQFDHLTRSYFGWLGSFVIGGADMAMRAMSDEPTKPALDYFRFGTQGILKEAGTGGSRYVTQVYEQAKELEQAHATWRQMLKDGRIEEAKDYAADNRDKLIRYRQVDAVKRTESNLNERIRRIERSDMDSSEKKNAIALVNKQKEAVAMRIAPGIQYGP